MKSSDLLCSASIAGGLLTLESGQTIDLALIERSLRLIRDLDPNPEYPCVVIEALGEAVVTAQEALEQFNRLKD